MATSSGYARQVDSFEDQGINGEWYAAGRGPMSVPNSQALRVTIENPLGSGRLLLLHRFRPWSSTDPDDFGVMAGPTTNLPVFVVASGNRRVGLPAGVGVVRTDVGVPMSGGIATEYRSPIASGPGTTSYTEFIVYPTIIVPPGVTLGVNVTNPSGSTAQMTALLDWREVAFR